MTFLSLLIALTALHVAVSVEETISVRMVVNHGKSLSPRVSCTRPEISRIQSTLLEAIQEVSNENLAVSPLLRGKATKISVDTSFCWDYCNGAAPGTCWLLDERCRDTMRYWNLATHFRSNSSNSDLHPNMLMRQDNLNEITDNRCHSYKQNIENAIQTILQSSVSLTHSCKNMLRQQIDMTCVKVPENTDRFQSQ